MNDHDTYGGMAARIEAAAEKLEYEAEHAAEILPGRANGDKADPQGWADRKRDAARTAREYAAELRAVNNGSEARLIDERLAQAERVASAAELGGILIDGRPLDEADAAHSASARKAWEEGTSYSQQKAREIEATGRFTHVDETIDGVKQVPFWQLGGHTDQAIRDRVDAEQRAHRYEPFEGHRGDEDDYEY